MSSVFTNQLRQNINRAGAALTPPMDTYHGHVKVQSLNGVVLNIKDMQAQTLHTQRASYRMQATSNFQNVLSTGGSIDIPWRSGAGNGYNYNLRLRIDVANASGNDIELMDVPGWFERIDFLTADSDVIQRIYEEDLRESLKTMRQREFNYHAPLMNMDGGFRPSGRAYPNGFTQSFYLPIPCNWIEETNIFTPAIAGEIIARLWFRDSNAIFISGTPVGVSITRLELEFLSPVMLAKEFQSIMDRHLRMAHDYRVFFPTQMRYSTTAGPNENIDILLSGFNGVFKNLTFFIRPANATLLNKFNFLTIDRYTILDSGGVDMLGNNDQYREENDLDFSMNYDNDYKRHNQIYIHDFSLSPLKDGRRGTVNGYAVFSGRETLRIYTETAVVNKVITLVSASAGAATAGRYKLCYHSPHDGVQCTDWLAFNANAAAIQTAINGLDSFRKSGCTVTVSGAITTDPTITFGGNFELCRDEPDAEIEVIGGNAFDDDYNSSITTEFRDGFPASGGVEVVISGDKLTRLTLNPNGSLNTAST